MAPSSRTVFYWAYPVAISNMAATGDLVSVRPTLSVDMVCHATDYRVVGHHTECALLDDNHQTMAHYCINDQCLNYQSLNHCLSNKPSLNQHCLNP